MISTANTDAAAPVLARLEGLTVRFPGSPFPAVKDLSLAVRAGDCVALVGESGSGKSLTARTLLGLLPHTAQASYDRLELSSSGALAAAPATGSRAWNAIRGIHAGLVPQDALGALDPLRRIEHEVGDALRLHRIVSGSERRSRVVSALEAAGMPEPQPRLRQRSDELSGGLRQRALVASALIADPGFIVADEPTTALDAGHRGRVLRELRRRVDAGAGALLITHDLTSVLDVADYVHVMRDGAIIESGRPDQVLRSPEHPFTRELLAASPARRPRGTRLLSAPPSPSASTPPSTAPVSASAAASHVPRLALADISASFRAPRQADRRTGSGAAASRHKVLDGASLAVAAGETVGLVGESGSGKTTLLRVALGLHPPDSGSVEVAGTNFTAASAGERRLLRRRVAFVPQDPLDSFPLGARGEAILSDALRAAGVPRAERRRRVRDLADEVALAHALLARPAAELSGGQRQRLALARALARGPEVLLLDEPVSALDVTVQARVLDLLDAIQEERGAGYLLVSHDPDVIAHMSDRVLGITDGAVAEA